jgi:deoxyribonuclease V
VRNRQESPANRFASTSISPRMHIPTLHRWPTTTSGAVDLQRTLAPRVQLTRIAGTPRYFGGIDLAFPGDGSEGIVAAVVWDAQGGAFVDEVVLRGPIRFPYISGLLSFREIPLAIRALRKLRHDPEVVLCDGQGIAHPRRLGLAAHLGLWLPVPTVGCAKSRLCGDHDEPALHRGAAVPLMHRGEQVGVVLRTRERTRPLYVSPGNRCDIASAARLTLASCTRYRMPEPTRRAHQLVTLARNT